jgi:hypothetical protein
VAELCYGSPGHRPLSGAELTEWLALEQIRVWEQEQAAKKRGKPGRR